MVKTTKDVLDAKAKIGTGDFCFRWLFRDNKGCRSGTKDTCVHATIGQFNPYQGVGHSFSQTVNHDGLIGEDVFSTVDQPTLNCGGIGGGKNRFCQISTSLWESGVDTHRLVADKRSLP